MMRAVRSVLGGAVLLLAGPLSVGAQISGTAEVVYLRTNCAGVTNCVTQMSQVTAFLWARTPRDRPVLVDIGPGNFLAFNCPPATPHHGYVTLRGSGRDRTRVSAFSANDCDKLSIQDLTVGGVGFPIIWDGGGSSQWSNVLIDANAFGEGYAIGWLDLDLTPSTPKALHYWFGSKVRAASAYAINIGFLVQSSEHWFYGGEVEADLTGLSSGGGFGSMAAVDVTTQGDFRIFGSAVRSRVGTHCGGGTLYGVRVSGLGLFHMHGGIIDADASPSVSCATGIHATALRVSDQAHAHTPGTAFGVSANTPGQATRLSRLGQGEIDSPFLWPPGGLPPAVVSRTGADLFVENDCISSTSCNGVGTQTHLMIYNTDCCPNAQWFDATAGRCRNAALAGCEP
jgi:hypothetical protein